MDRSAFWAVVLGLASALCLPACFLQVEGRAQDGGAGSTDDSGGPDAGRGSMDAGSSTLVDSGPSPGPDAGPDAGSDSGPSPGVDAGPPPELDAGPPPELDAGTDACLPAAELCNGIDDDCDGTVDDDCLAEIAEGAPWRSGTVAGGDSSVYFVMADAAHGPAEPDRIWWGMNGNWTRVRVPVVRADGAGSAELLELRAHHEMEGSASSTCTTPVPVEFEINAGRCAGYDHRVRLDLLGADNGHLSPGRWVTPASGADAVIEARRWHEPNSRLILQTEVPRLSYVRP